MWLVEDWGVDKFRDTIAEYMGDTLAKGKHMDVSLSSFRIGCVYLVSNRFADSVLAESHGGTAQPHYTCFS